MSSLRKGSLVLVTGANGYIASHVVDQLLQHGFIVRGTVRAAWKGDWLKEYVSTKHGEGKLDIRVVPDICADGAFDEVIKGVEAFIHVASDVSFSDDPEKVIPVALKGTENALAACDKETGLKHFVYTSSNVAAAAPKANTVRDITADDWAEESVKMAYSPDLDAWTKGLHVYGASKVLAERIVLEHAAKTTSYTVNTVVPNFNFGPILNPGKANSGNFIPLLFQKGFEGIGPAVGFPPQHFIDVRDTALLHIAPLLDSSIKGERIFAINDQWTWNDIIKVLRQLHSEHKLPDLRKTEDRDCFRYVAKERAEEILQKVFGQPKMRSLVETVQANIAHLE